MRLQVANCYKLMLNIYVSYSKFILCTYVCDNVFMCVCACVCIHVWMRAYVCKCMYACVYMCQKFRNAKCVCMYYYAVRKIYKNDNIGGGSFCKL